MISIFTAILCWNRPPVDDDVTVTNTGAALNNITTITQALEMQTDRWVGPFAISGSGVNECGEVVAKSKGWDTCKQKAQDATSITGLSVSVVDVRIENYWRKDEEGPWYDHWHKCKYGANVFCLLRTTG